MNKFKRCLAIFIFTCMAITNFGANIIVKATNNVISEIGSTRVSKVVATVFGDTTNSKGFTWYTGKELASSDLQLVEKLSVEANFEESIRFKGENYIPTNSPNEIVHKAVATNLKENTEYFYRVGDSNLNIWSDVGTFKTASKDGEFTFINMADTQSKTEEEAKLSSETIAKALNTVNDAAFISLNGDLVDKGKNENEWDWLFGYSQSSLLNTTFVPVAGNHESEKNSFIDHFNLDVAEGSDTTSGAYYSYDYSNAHFIVLNNNEDSEEFRDFSVHQIEWLKNDVAKAKENGAEWIIVQMHKGPYTTSNHATDDDIMGTNGVRTKVAPLMEELGVDLVLQGHDHIYSRTKALKNGVPVGGEKIKETVNGLEVDYEANPQGTIYMTPNTAGPKVYYKNKDIDPSYYDLFEMAEEHPAGQYGDDPEKPGRPARGMIQNFVSIKIDGDELTSITYEIDQNKNNGHPYVVDSFGILKESAVSEREAISKVIEKINSISEKVTLEDKALVIEARELYNLLNEDQKELIINYDKLVSSETKIAELEKDKQDRDIANLVIDKINKIPEKITKESKSLIEEARKAYDNLEEHQKLLVKNYNKLVSAEEKITKLINNTNPGTENNNGNNNSNGNSGNNNYKDGNSKLPYTGGTSNSVLSIMGILMSVSGYGLLKKRK